MRIVYRRNINFLNFISISCIEMTRINNIESKLKNNPKDVSTNDLIYYLKINSNNNILDEQYLQKINNSFFFENIFVNTSNYTVILSLIIGLLIPFYYFYPRFYKLGFIGTSIGIISLICLYFKINNLYSNFFSQIGILFLLLTIIIYTLFFVTLNKLNHISLFFISAIISYLIINYILRIILTLPIKNNIYNKFNATLNNNIKYTEYNLLLESACLEIIERFNLKLPSGNMLYSYLTIFDIGENNNELSNFLTNLFGPILAIIILWLLGYFISLFNIFPLIGLNNNKYFNCQANYILPKELNVNLLIHQLIDKYNFNNDIYSKVEKTLLRISKELLLKYNPKFIKIENENGELILENLKNNKIFIQINKILKKNNFGFNLNYLDDIKQIITNENIPYKNKIEIFDLLSHINNILLIKNEVNEGYENDSILARDELLYDKDIKEEYKETLKNIIDKYIIKFTDNLNLKDGTLFGYHYNIVTYELLNNNIRIYFNKIFENILGLFSIWLLFAKPISSSWLFSQYIFNSNLFISKYSTMGLDDEFLILPKGTNIINITYSIILFILITPLFYMYNSIIFGFITTPLWYILLYQIAFIINIIGNIWIYNNNGSYLNFNAIYIIFLIILTVITYFIKK
jgi:hypothetical protein